MTTTTTTAAAAINIIVFSKNRAMQLDLCLRSLKTHFVDYTNHARVSVIYDATDDDDFLRGYEKTKERHPEVNYIQQTIFPADSFRDDTLTAVGNSEHDSANTYTMFLVDDVVFKDNFSLTDEPFRLLANNDQMLALSLRLHKKASYCYALNQNMKLPQFTRSVKDKFFVWKYHGCEGDWGYGMSVDGNVYNTKFMSWLLSRLNFNNPNSLEAAMNSPVASRGIRPMFLSCYDGPGKLLNVPANRVQETFQNRHESSHDPKELNKRYLDGEQISLKNISGIDNFSVHYPIDFEFEKG